MRLNDRLNLIWLALVLGSSAGFIFLSNAPYVEAQSSAHLTLLQSDASRIVLEFEASGFEARSTQVSGIGYGLYSIGDLGHTTEPGKPQLPLQGTMVAIPPGAQATLKILQDQTQTSAITQPPLPAPTQRVNADPTRPIPATPTITYPPDRAAFSTLYPSTPAHIGSTGDWRSQHYLTVQFFPLQYDGATRQLILHRRVQVEITLSYPRGASPAMLGGAVNEGAFESTFEKSFINYSSAKNWRAPATGLTAPVPSAPRTSSTCPNAIGPCYKIGVDIDSIYKVSCDHLSATSSITPTTFQMFKNGTELAIEVSGSWGTSCTSNDYVLFFGQAINSKYSTTNNYWLTYGINPGLRIQSRNGTPDIGTPATQFTQTVHLEKNVFYLTYTPTSTVDFEHWYWDPVGSGFPFQTYTFQADYVASAASSPTLQSSLIGFQASIDTPVTHHSRIDFNNCANIDGGVWGGNVERLTTVAFPHTCLISGTNAFTVTEFTDYFANNQILTNYFNISYPRTFDVVSDTIRFQQPASDTWHYTINGFSNSSVEAFDVTNPFSVTQIISGSTSGAPTTFQFSDTNNSPRDYLAQTTALRRSPTSIVKDTSSNLRGANAADYMVISASSLITAVQPLVTLRNGQFPRPVKLVDVQDVYDEFGDGMATPQAIRDFLQYAYTNWTAPKPSYVLLVGAGNVDPKYYCPGITNSCPFNIFHTPANSNLIPPYLLTLDPWIGETASDNCLVSFAAPCSLTSHTMPYMHIGRLPADSAADVTALINKIIAYENPTAGKWRSTSAFVADNGFTNGSPCTVDIGGNFFSFSEEIVGNSQYYPSSMIGQRIYYNPYQNCWPTSPSYDTPSATHDAIIGAINEGRLIVNYIGHGGFNLWSGESLFENGDLAALHNGNRTPVMLELTCETGYYVSVQPGQVSLAKSNVNLLGNGAVASWAAVGQGLVTGHDLLEKGFFDAVMNQNKRQLGPATTAGKANLNASSQNLDLLDTIILFGDPASRIPIQMTINFPLIFR